MRHGSEWYKRDPQAYLGGVQGLSSKEHAVYSVVLDLIYVHGGSVNNDPKWIAGWISDMGSAAVRKAIHSLCERGKISIENGKMTAINPPESQSTREPISLVMRRLIFERDGEVCRYCADTSGPFELDHVIPVSRGGRNKIDNLVVACRTCNRRKSDRTPDEMGWEL